jgi:biotin-independent malonate decarboxylase gamma subunit
VSSRGGRWFDAFASGGTRVPTGAASVLAADVMFGAQPVRVLTVVPDPQARFVRARGGEFGIDEGYALAAAVDGTPANAAILSVVDVPGQAFGVREEAIGLQRALAASADALIRRRRAGTPIAALIVGRAISGAFLASGIQAGWIGALRDAAVEVHVMSAAAVARVTLMDPQMLERIAAEVPATSRSIEAFASLGAIDELFDVADADAPSPAELDRIRAAIANALASPLALRAPRERAPRALASRVRERIDAAWE